MQVRRIQEGDGAQLSKLIEAYLTETYAGGADFPPTRKNITVFTLFALEGATVGDPCLVVEDDDQLVGFCLIRGIDFYDCDVREKSCRSHGTYILPAFRSKGVAVNLFIVAARMAKLIGYDRLLGFTAGTEYEERTLGVLSRIPGMTEIGRVLMLPIRSKARLENVDAGAVQ